MKKVVYSSLVALLASSCSPINDDLLNEPNGEVMEIAVRMVKDGQIDEFKQARSAFIPVLREQEGVLVDREFESFYAMPEPDKRKVFIGMTTYETAETIGDVQSTWSVVSKFLDFKKTMDLKAYVFVQQTEGSAFDLATVAKTQGQVLEVGIRRVKSGKEAEFNRLRKEFVKLLSSYDGVLDSYEFKVVGGDDIEGLTVGMTVYENQEAFMALAGPIMEEKVTRDYFATFDIVASQFAFTTTSN